MRYTRQSWNLLPIVLLIWVELWIERNKKNEQNYYESGEEKCKNIDLNYYNKTENWITFVTEWAYTRISLVYRTYYSLMLIQMPVFQCQQANRSLEKYKIVERWDSTTCDYVQRVKRKHVYRSIKQGGRRIGK